MTSNQRLRQEDGITLFIGPQKAITITIPIVKKDVVEIAATFFSSLKPATKAEFERLLNEANEIHFTLTTRTHP